LVSIALFICQEIFEAPVVFLVIHENLLSKSFSWYWVLFHLVSTYGSFGLFVRTLLCWEFVISFSLLYFICLNEINLSVCVFYFILYAQWFYLVHLLNFVE
jgi:hypothetical protein